MGLILGLDVSTSMIGVCIVDPDVVPDDAGSHILLLDRIEFKKCRTLWEKADKVEDWLQTVYLDPNFGLGSNCIDRIVVEEPLMGFRPGMSSAQTISTLMRFNGIVSYAARNAFEQEPEYVGSGHARKLCGIKLQRTAIGGAQKEQVFAYMAEHDLKHVAWPVKKGGKTVEWSRDACDAYVIARAAMINGPFLAPVKKPKKPKKAHQPPTGV